MIQKLCKIQFWKKLFAIGFPYKHCNFWPLCLLSGLGHLVFSCGPVNYNPLKLLLAQVSQFCSQSSQDATAENAEGQQSNTIIFNSSKGELFTPNNGFKSLVRKLRSNWKVVTYVMASLYGANNKFSVLFT